MGPSRAEVVMEAVAGCWGTDSLSSDECFNCGDISSKPVVDSNTVHLFKAISNMSCLTSFKSYLTPRNSPEFTVRIKEENSQRQRNYHFHFVHGCCLERTWQGCLPTDQNIITALHCRLFHPGRKMLPFFFFSQSLTSIF